jgi:hypothetical protein
MFTAGNLFDEEKQQPAKTVSWIVELISWIPSKKNIQNSTQNIFLEEKIKLTLVTRIKKQNTKFDLAKEKLGFLNHWLWI